MYKNQSDEDLMLLYARKNDFRAFEMLFSRYDKQLVFFVSRRQSCGALAQDICQETWRSIIAAKDNYTPSATFKTYIYCIVHNKLIDFYRKQNNNPLNKLEDTLDDEQKEKEALFVDDTIANDPVECTSQEQMRDLLGMAMSELSVDEKEILSLRYEVELTVPEIAEVLGISLEAGKSRIRYAKAKLRKLCTEKYSDLAAMFA